MQKAKAPREPSSCSEKLTLEYAPDRSIPKPQYALLHLPHRCRAQITFPGRGKTASRRLPTAVDAVLGWEVGPRIIIIIIIWGSDAPGGVGLRYGCMVALSEEKSTNIDYSSVQCGRSTDDACRP